ncbi:unnamed protein product [Spodoptera littoralis]|uniref:Peptidase S1 domain-containing protein n=1 Tax=Spodoptera littoralis TaxID=7109 RepID=A0A9P0N4V6_SPOLI|nr:unnamed protein product [Spodoptera littoralis]CAH1642527.1 unnamed protein product [Spodoptera littoralis]
MHTYRQRPERKMCQYEDCPTAIRDLKFNIHPHICSFNGTSKIPIICCLEEAKNITAILGPDALTSSLQDQGLCPLFDSNAPNNKKPKNVPETSKAWNKCLEYQAKIKLPCKDGRKKITPYCSKQEELIVGGGGVDAEKDEFPHMTLLTYGKEFMKSFFGCGGSLISEKYVLTAGHCTATSRGVPVSFAIFGILRFEEMHSAPKENVREIQKIIKHPEFKPPSTYHDIALLELDKEVVFSPSIRPACLKVDDDFEHRAYAAGWGLLGYRQENANVLQNIPLWRVADEVCSAKYLTHRTFINGLDNDTQICYGDDGIVRDTCSGDSGGPLQIRNENVFCTHLILGVTSFGKYRCGEVGTPGVYTKVPHYVPWIESVVWP